MFRSVERRAVFASTRGTTLPTNWRKLPGGSPSSWERKDSWVRGRHFCKGKVNLISGRTRLQVGAVERSHGRVVIVVEDPPGLHPKFLP